MLINISVGDPAPFFTSPPFYKFILPAPTSFKACLPVPGSRSYQFLLGEADSFLAPLRHDSAPDENISVSLIWNLNPIKKKTGHASVVCG